MTVHESSSQASPAIITPALSTAFLDGLRGLAALYVLAHHAALLCHQGYRYGYLKHPETYTAAGKIGVLLLNVFRFGHEGVIFFFVLSGFVIHLGIARRLRDRGEQARFGWAGFVKRRALRLYPPLIFALVLTYGVDRRGMSQGYVVYTGGTQSPILNDNVHADHRASTLMGNLAFTMQSNVMWQFVPVWGTDAPLWSLKYEWWFYMLYPALWPIFRRSLALATMVVTGFFVASFFPAIWPIALLRDVSSMMLIWWVGALLAEVYVGRTRIAFGAIAPLALLLPPLAVLTARGKEVHPLFWGLGFAGIIAAGFAWQGRGRALPLLDRLKWLGDCSYTLYVCHMPPLVLLCGWLIARSPTGELPQNFGWVAGSVAIMIPLAWAAHLVVERPFISRRAHAVTMPG